MIVLPNSYERYLSALRIFVSLSVLKHGLKHKHLEMLKKITIAEAFYNKNTTQNVDIYKLCKNLLNGVKALKPKFNFHIIATETHRINKLLFSILLLVIAERTDDCKIKTDCNNIIIKTNIQKNTLSQLLSALGGYSLYEKSQDRLLIVLPAPVTDKSPVYTESEWEYIFDKFSVLNIFLSKHE